MRLRLEECGRGDAALAFFEAVLPASRTATVVRYATRTGALLRGTTWPDAGADFGEQHFSYAYAPSSRATVDALERAAGAPVRIEDESAVFDLGAYALRTFRVRF